MAKESGLNTNPGSVAELGPGDSLGIGLAALLSGAGRYSAFDVYEFSTLERNLEVLEGLVALFRAGRDIPHGSPLPDIKPYLNDYRFPRDILTPERLDHCLRESRLEQIRWSLRNMRDPESLITYRVPWNGSRGIEGESVDLIYSQAVLEHIQDLPGAYAAMHAWLKPTGFMSHQIDFKCHGMADEWNGHWTCGDLVWKLVEGRREYSINREPLSTHVRLLEEAGFTVVHDQKVTLKSRLRREQLAPRFRDLNDSDLETAGAFIQSVKRAFVLNRR
jgi:hypothetical protein